VGTNTFVRGRRKERRKKEGKKIHGLIAERKGGCAKIRTYSDPSDSRKKKKGERKKKREITTEIRGM